MNIFRYSIAAIIIAFVPALASASMQNEMDSLFSDMSNFTAPGAYESQTRGTFSGGRYTVKSKIIEQNLVTITPGGAKAGCSGLDMYGGSFSFINSDQLVQTLRAVAANAKGYIFQLALDNVAPDISKHIENFQKKIQALNQYLGNSCQLAQGIVNDTITATAGKDAWKKRTNVTAKGMTDDFFSSWDSQTNDDDIKANEPAEYYKDFVGNLMYSALKKTNTAASFQYGDGELIEAIMAMTGVYIIGESTNDDDGKQTNPITEMPAVLSITEIINGGSDLTVYECASHTHDACTTVTKKTTDLTGLGKQLREVFLGDGSNVGLVQKFSTNAGGVTDEEKAILTVLPNGTGALVRNLALRSPYQAEAMAIDASDLMAYEIVRIWVTNTFDAVEQALSVNQENAFYKQAQQSLEKNRKKFLEESQTYALSLTKTQDLISRYNTIMQALPKKNYDGLEVVR